MSTADDRPSQEASPDAARDRSQADVFARLGVRRRINAYETVSMLGGTRTHPAVLDAMRAASDAFVDLGELQRAIGRRLAELTRNEAAAVTNGASAGLVLAALACATARDPRFPLGLTQRALGALPQVIVQRCQMSPYVQNVAQAGVELVEVGYVHSRTPEASIQGALSDRSVAVLYTAGRPYERDAIELERVVALSHEADVPVIVDAAALLPPASNLWHFTALGADLVVFSGGKGLHGPQDSGFVVGRRDLIDTIQTYASPAHGPGRAFKSSKEDMVGLLRSVELLLEADEEARYVSLLQRARRVAGGLYGVPGIDVRVLPDGRQGQPCPRTVVTLLPDSRTSRAAFMAALRDGEPSIIVGPLDEDAAAVYVHPLSLTDAEADAVVARVRAILMVPATAASRPSTVIDEA